MTPLRVLCPRAERHSLHAPRVAHAAIAHAIGVLERPCHDLGDAFDVSVRVHRPDRARHERIVVEDAQRLDTVSIAYPHSARASGKRGWHVFSIAHPGCQAERSEASLSPLVRTGAGFTLANR